MAKAVFRLDSESGELQSYVYEDNVGAIAASINVDKEFIKPDTIYTADLKDGQVANIQEKKNV